MNPSNTVSVTRLIQEIQSELKGQTGSWRKVSELLNQADVEFGFGTDKMKQILHQTDISPSKASKLISIAQDGRLRARLKSLCLNAMSCDSSGQEPDARHHCPCS